jgi:hypothetical protein
MREVKTGKTSYTESPNRLEVQPTRQSPTPDELQGLQYNAKEPLLTSSYAAAGKKWIAGLVTAGRNAIHHVAKQQAARRNQYTHAGRSAGVGFSADFADLPPVEPPAPDGVPDHQDSNE